MPMYLGSLTIEDGEGDKSVVTANITADRADGARVAITALGNAILPYIGGKIVAASVSEQVPLTAFGANPAAPDALSDVERKAQFIMRAANNRSARLSVATTPPTSFKPNSDEVTDAFRDAVVGALTAAHEDGAGGNARFTDNTASNLSVLKKAVEAYGRRR